MAAPAAHLAKPDRRDMAAASTGARRRRRRRQRLRQCRRRRHHQPHACYCPGTLIQTARGEQRVEKLAIGDRGHDRVRRGAADQMDRAAQLWRPLRHGPQRHPADLHQGRRARRQRAASAICGSRRITPCILRARRRADRGQGPRQRRLDRAGRARREGRIFPHRARQPRRDRRRRRVVGKLHRRRQPRHVPQRARIPTRSMPTQPPAPAHYCAPRCDEATRSKPRAGASRCAPGLLRAADGERSARCAAMSTKSARHRIAGWAQNADHPEAPVCLDIFADGRLIGQVLANRYRDDLARRSSAADVTALTFIAVAAIFRARRVELRRSRDGAGLPRAPQTARATVKVYRRARALTPTSGKDDHGDHHGYERQRQRYRLAARRASRGSGRRHHQLRVERHHDRSRLVAGHRRRTSPSKARSQARRRRA